MNQPSSVREDPQYVSGVLTADNGGQSDVYVQRGRRVVSSWIEPSRAKIDARPVPDWTLLTMVGGLQIEAA